MRLLLRLKCSEKCDYEMNYHYYLQGLIYNLIRDTPYAHIHDKEGFKFFCYSNIIPISSPIMNDDNRTLIISSPDANFISVLHGKLEKLKEAINIGTMKFIVYSVQKLDIKIPRDRPFTMITGTPIVIRIPPEKYKKYDIKSTIDYNYLYWKADHPLELFISQLWNNLLRKYNEYFATDLGNRTFHYHIDPFKIFGELIFKKQISTKIFVKKTEQIVIGTTWEFLFERLEYKDMMQFALDVGLGERNSMGFGFMNVKK